MNAIKRLFERIKAKFGAQNVERTTTSEEITKKDYAHQQVINQLLAYVGLCKMDVELKMILRMRVWGKNPKVFSPMSFEAIAKDLSRYGHPVRAKDVQRWEQDALWNVEQFIKKYNAAEAVEQFKRDQTFKKILQPERRIIG